MDEENVIYTYMIWILLKSGKEGNPIVYRKMDEPAGIMLTIIRQKEKDKYRMMSLYMWNTFL